MQIDRHMLRESWHSWLSNDNRPRAGPWWLQWVWTLLFCAAVALGFTILGFFAFGSGSGAWRNLQGWGHWYGKNLIVSLTIGVLVHAMFDGARALGATPPRIRRWKPWQRSLFFGGLPVAGMLIGWPLGVHFAGGHLSRWLSTPEGANIIAGSVLVGLMLSFLMHHWFGAKARQLDAERRATEAQLRLLQGQIEPHFLFNTLANVQALIDTDVPRARQMLESFTDYLRSSLGTLRAERATLGSELGLAEAYLSLLKTRMEERLSFDITNDPALSATPLPPLVLQPLVENAIHHGLEPKLDGGSVHIATRTEGRQLVIEVHDDGLGLAAPQRHRRGAGMALANLRERLAAQYGGSASLDLADAMPGTRVTLRLPLEMPA